VEPPKQNADPLYDRAEFQVGRGYESITAIPRVEPRRILWMRLLWKEREFLRRVTIRGLILATLVAFLLPVRYESTTRLMPPDEQSGSGLAMLAAFAGKGSSTSGSGLGGALGGGLGGMAGDLLGLKSSGALFVNMLEGPTVQDGLIQRFDLRKVYWDRYWADARQDLKKHTDISEDRKSGVITVAVTDHDPYRAQQMAQAYVEQLDELVAQVSTSSARRERQFIEQRLKTVKQNLDDASQQFSEYASKNGTLDVPSQTKAMVENEASLQGQLIAAQSQLESLQQIYMDNNIRVRSLRAQVDSLKHQVENMSGNKADLNSDQSAIAGDFPSIRKLPLLGVRWATLYRGTKIQETVYELLTQQYEFAKIQEAKEIPTVMVLDTAELPEKKSFPPRTWIIVLGTVFSVLLAGALVIGSAAWNENQSPEKQLAREIWGEASANGFRPFTRAHYFWNRIGGRNGSSHEASDNNVRPTRRNDDRMADEET
jgi:capsule polysaccharide export protein KpsE/RkpR